MRIRRFNEGREEISADSANEMSTKLKEICEYIIGQRKELDSMVSRLEGFKSDSKKGNDQIDDSILSMQSALGYLIKIEDDLSNSATALEDYAERGSSFLYEKK